MRIGDVAADEFRRQARTSGITFATGPFVVRLKSDITGFLATFQNCYGALELLDAATGIAHFHVDILRRQGARRLLRPQADFRIAGHQPFDPYPLSQAFPMFEWGLNWCIGTMAHQYLLLHSAVLERDGRAVIMPAQPGSGKSTLCAAMTARGWRLLSDEFGILSLESGLVLPLPRAAPLKNESISVMSDFAPDLRYGPVFDRTRKGRVVHLFPSSSDLLAQEAPASPALVVFPRYEAGGTVEVTEQPRSVALTRLVNNSFNYLLSGEAGFRTLVALLGSARCIQLVYGDLEAAIARVSREHQQAQ